MNAVRILALLAATLAVAACERKVDTIAQPDPSNTAAMTAKPFQDRRITNPFPHATQLRLFVEVGYTDAGKPILSKSKGIQLNATQRSAFENGLKIIAAPEEESACFMPHHFFRYYDASGKRVGNVAVCFCCYGVGASGSKALEPPDGAMLSADYAKVRALVTALGEPADVLCD